MLYLWVIPEKAPNKDVGIYDDESSPDRFLLLGGRALKDEEFKPNPTVNFDMPKKKLLTYDCLINNIQIPLVNIRTKYILEKIIPNEVQFFPAKVVCKDGEIEGYYFLNVTHEVKGIDHEKSIYKKIPGLDSIMYFHYLTYLNGCMGDLQIARDEEYHGNLLATEKIKSIFDKEQITGVRFVRPEEFYRPFTAADLINEYKRDSEM